MTRTNASALALALCGLLLGCASADDPVVQADEDFAIAWTDMADSFGDGKADLFGFDIQPCRLLKPLLAFGNDLIHAGLVLGVSGETVLGTEGGMGGYDLVWDLYHQQMTVSRYSGSGLGFPRVGASVSAYVGAAFGFDHGVSDWDGFMVTASADVGLPWLKNYLSLKPATFVSGVDDNGDGWISPAEILLPPQGVYGFSMGVSLGFDLLPSPLPISGSLTEGYWQPHQRAIRYFYDQLRGTRMFYVKALQARLVDGQTGEQCADSWPDVEGSRDCVIEFGREGDSAMQRAVYTAYSICHIAGRCAVPLSWPLSGTALAIGALRSSGLDLEALCAD